MEPSSLPVEVNSPRGMNKRQRLRGWHVVDWCMLGWHDFVFQHRRTMFGPDLLRFFLIAGNFPWRGSHYEQSIEASLAY